MHALSTEFSHTCSTSTYFPSKQIEDDERELNGILQLIYLLVMLSMPVICNNLLELVCIQVSGIHRAANH